MGVSVASAFSVALNFVAPVPVVSREPILPWQASKSSLSVWESCRLVTVISPLYGVLRSPSRFSSGDASIQAGDGKLLR